MSEQLFKAHVQYSAFSATDLSKQVSAPIAIALEATEDRNRQLAYPIYEQAMAWLDDNDKQAAFVNLYDNTDHMNGKGELVFVFDDRDTALLFKLAMG